MTALQKSYSQSATEQTRAASAGFAVEISRLGELLKSAASRVGADTIAAANVTRQIGTEISAWLNREQMRFENFELFFRQHAAELPEWLDSDSARKFISAHKAHPDEVKDLKTAVNILSQTTFFAVGLLEEPKRTLQQTASGSGPLEKLMSIWGKEREALQKFKLEIPESSWTTEIWETVRRQTRESAELHAKAGEILKK
jgi:hypothetical protein